MGDTNGKLELTAPLGTWRAVLDQRDEQMFDRRLTAELRTKVDDAVAALGSAGPLDSITVDVGSQEAWRDLAKGSAPEFNDARERYSWPYDTFHWRGADVDAEPEAYAFGSDASKNAWDTTLARIGATRMGALVVAAREAGEEASVHGLEPAGKESTWRVPSAPLGGPLEASFRPRTEASRRAAEQMETLDPTDRPEAVRAGALAAAYLHDLEVDGVEPEAPVVADLSSADWFVGRFEVDREIDHDDADTTREYLAYAGAASASRHGRDFAARAGEARDAVVLAAGKGDWEGCDAAIADYREAFTGYAGQLVASHSTSLGPQVPAEAITAFVDSSLAREAQWQAAKQAAAEKWTGPAFEVPTPEARSGAVAIVPHDSAPTGPASGSDKGLEL